MRILNNEQLLTSDELGTANENVYDDEEYGELKYDAKGWRRNFTSAGKTARQQVAKPKPKLLYRCSSPPS